MRRSFLIQLLTAFLLSACATTGAEPERFAGMDCKTLSDLSKSYSNSLSNIDLFNDGDVNELERSGKSQRIIGQSRSDLRPYEKAREKDINSIRAASRLKGC